jgi:glycosyltransferase involved in cell wall biosynthesis
VKIAVLHPYPVHAGAVGGTTRVNALVRFLAPRHEVSVFAHSSGCEATDVEAVAELAAIGVEQTLCPRPSASIADRLGWVLGADPYFVGFNRNPELEAALARRSRSPGIDVIHLEFGYLAPLLGGIVGRPRRILAEQETMSLVVKRLGRVPIWRRTPYESFLATQSRKVRSFEARALPTFDRLFAITPEERRAMSAIAGREVEVLPHVVSTRRFRPGAAEKASRTVLFVGNYRHRPNLHGLLWFVDEIWPAVAEAVPDALLEVVGPGLGDRSRRRLERGRIRVAGRVEDLAFRYRAAAVFVNPILSGGGMRGKVLEAFSCGLPVVSTRMGMEGIAAEDGVEALVADDARDFARQVQRYLVDPELRRSHGMAARRLVESTYDTRVVFARLEEGYRECVNGHREQHAW